MRGRALVSILVGPAVASAGLFHQPYGDYYGSWRAMRTLNQQDMVKAIGVANFYPDRLVDLIDRTGFTPAINQIETHPYFQRQADHDLMAGRGVQHESWGGFAEGRNNLFSDPTLTQIGTAHGKSVARVVLRWLTQRNIVAIPKSVRPERMAQTSTSSTSPSATTTWPASPPWTPAPSYSSTTATPPWSAPSETGPSTTDDPTRLLVCRVRVELRVAGCGVRSGRGRSGRRRR
ncbi:MAG: aldo/keto reductase [Streptosporangiaceae bacterium]